ncbi:carboxymuconolactone decarboxylase family protein [Achromobacter spanius]|uniref:carboxymuconolactone decarboxylase family protein n=1 Tax=Achromobacter spanius TaxID=217203 RepID=UPI0036F12706
MKISPWTPDALPQPQDLVSAIAARRGGSLTPLDHALLWSEPLARGWNTYLNAVRTELGACRQLRELGICTVGLITGARYEYHHHAPAYITAGGSKAGLEALSAYIDAGAKGQPAGLTDDEALVVMYAVQMTRDVLVDDALFAKMQARFGTTQLVEITAAIATYNMVARFLVALGITPET